MSAPIQLSPYDGGGVCSLCNGDAHYGFYNDETGLSVEMCSSCMSVCQGLIEQGLDTVKQYEGFMAMDDEDDDDEWDDEED